MGLCVGYHESGDVGRGLCKVGGVYRCPSLRFLGCSRIVLGGQRGRFLRSGCGGRC